LGEKAFPLLRTRLSLLLSNFEAALTMVFFLSKALVSVVAVIAGALLGIKAFHNRLIVDKVRQNRIVDSLLACRCHLRSQEPFEPMLSIVLSALQNPVQALPESAPEEVPLLTKTLPEGEIKKMSSGSDAGGSSGPWPECVGKTGSQCVAIIEEQAPDVRGNVFVIPEGSMVTMDYRTDRVRVFVDEAGTVKTPPQRG
jgi:hypothetical protein